MMSMLKRDLYPARCAAPRHRFRAPLLAALVAALVLAAGAPPAMGYTRESPEVRALVDKGKKYLEEHSREERLGGRCLLGLVYIKEGELDHRFVKEALQACQEAAAKGDADDVYSNGLAIIFLSELDAKKHEKILQFFLAAMHKRQKQHGGWGYDGRSTGDTSQTQYGCLGLWEAFQHGVPINQNAIDGVVRWLIATQDPSGGWGYQGEIATGDQLVEQSEITCSLVSAAMGSLLICADLVGILEPGAAKKEESPLPAAVKIASSRDAKRKRLSAANINRERLLQAIARGDAWMDKNYRVSIERYTSYYLYALERHKTLQAILEGGEEPEPDWYNNGVKYLIETQGKDGEWSTGTGPECDTAFSILFLIRSMQITLGSFEGAALAGRGVPSDLRNLRVRGDKLVAVQPKTEMSQLLLAIDDGKLADLDAIISGSSELVIEKVDKKSAQRLKQVVRSGEPAARIVAVRALAQSGDFDHVPTLLYAFRDDDPYVVREARDGLRFLSRRFEGFGLQERYDRQGKLQFDQNEQFEALDKWIKWYQGIRPGVPIALD